MARRVLSRVLLAAMAEHYITLQEDEVIVPSSKGHTTASAEAMMKKWGKNEIPEEKEPVWRMLSVSLLGSVRLLTPEAHPRRSERGASRPDGTTGAAPLAPLSLLAPRAPRGRLASISVKPI